MLVRQWPDYPENYPQKKPTEVRIVQKKKHCRGTTMFIGDEQESEATSNDKKGRQLNPASSLRTRTHRKNQAVDLFKSL